MLAPRGAWGLLCLVAWLSAAGSLLPAQQTSADSARVLLEAARVLERQGQISLAHDLLRHVMDRWPGSPAAAEAQRQRAALPVARGSGLSRTSFIVYNTLYGAFLGLAVPAALGADSPEPYGAGLLLGTPLGFFTSRAYTSRHGLTEGQAAILNFSSFWGTWQGLGWRAALDIGDQEVCEVSTCFRETPETAPWAAAVAGGVTGLAAGILLSRTAVAAETAALVLHGALWGSWYGFAYATITDLDDDPTLAAALVGGNAGLVLALLTGGLWRPTPGQVWIASAGGVAGGLAGLGLALLVRTDDAKTTIGLMTAGATAGLIAGAVLGRERQSRRLGRAGLEAALFTVREGTDWRIGLPVPVPAALPVERPGQRSHVVPGIRLYLFDAWF